MSAKAIVSDMAKTSSVEEATELLNNQIEKLTTEIEIAEDLRNKCVIEGGRPEIIAAADIAIVRAKLHLWDLLEENGLILNNTH